MQKNLFLIVGLILGVVLGGTLGAFLSGAFTTNKTVGGHVVVTGSQGLVLNTTSLDFGGMVANQTKTLAFTLKNVGCCLLNLTYSTNMGTLPAPSVMVFGSIGGGSLLDGLPTYIPANSTYVYGVRLTLGTLAIYGRTYNFNVTITAFTQ